MLQTLLQQNDTKQRSVFFSKEKNQFYKRVTSIWTLTTNEYLFKQCCAEHSVQKFQFFLFSSEMRAN